MQDRGPPRSKDMFQLTEREGDVACARKLARMRPAVNPDLHRILTLWGVVSNPLNPPPEKPDLLVLHSQGWLNEQSVTLAEFAPYPNSLV